MTLPTSRYSDPCGYLVSLLEGHEEALSAYMSMPVTAPTFAVLEQFIRQTLVRVDLHHALTHR